MVEGRVVFKSGLLVDIFSLANRRRRAPLVSGCGNEAAGDEGTVAAFNGELLSGMVGFDLDNCGVRGALNGDDCGVLSLEVQADVLVGSGHSSLYWSVFVVGGSTVLELA